MLGQVKLKDLHHGRIFYLVNMSNQISEHQLTGKPKFDGKNWFVDVGKSNFGWPLYLGVLGIGKNIPSYGFSLAFKKKKHAIRYRKWLESNEDFCMMRDELDEIISNMADFKQVEGIYTDGGEKKCITGLLPTHQE